MNFIIDGGWQFMIPLIVLLFVIIVLFVKSLKVNTEKNSKLIRSIGLFCFVFGVFEFVLGLLGALEAISVATSVSYQVLAGGFRVGLIAPTFGLFIFVLSRLFDIILLWKRED